jgi:hypothetical protein
MDYFRLVPPEIYQEFLFFLEPKDIIDSCCCNKYALTIYDEAFYQEYIKRNFSISFNTLPVIYARRVPHSFTYKQLLYILVNGRTFSCEIIDAFSNDISKINVKICFEDSLHDVFCNMDKIIQKTQYFSYVYETVIIGKIDNKNVALLSDLCGTKYIDDLAIVTENTTISIELIKKLNKKLDSQLFPSTTPINKICSDKGFYFNIFKIWVYQQTVD